MMDDTGLVTEQLEKFVKRIPTQGFGNKNNHGFPTLPKRIENLRWHPPYVPPQMALGTEYDRTQAKQIFKKGLSKLIKLQNYLIGADNFNPKHLQEMRENLSYAQRCFNLIGENLGLILKRDGKVDE